MITNWRNYFRCLLMELFFLGLAILIVTNFSLIYWWDIKWFNLVSTTGIQAKQLMSDYLRIIIYLQNPFSKQLDLQFFHSSLNGLNHFRDVKHLFMLNQLMVLITGWLFIRDWRRLSKAYLRWKLLIPIKGFLVTILVLLTLIMVNFETWFIDFHRLFFMNQDWSFNPDDDPIILALPLPFFMQSFLLLIIITIGLNCWIYISGKRDLKRK